MDKINMPKEYPIGESSDPELTQPKTIIVGGGKKHKKFFTSSRKLIIIVVIILIIWLFHKEIVTKTIGLLKLNPTVWVFYSHVSSQIIAKHLLGLAYAMGFGALFFIFIPVELVFISYLTFGYNFLLVFIIALPCYLLGLIVDYIIGFIVGPKFFKYFYKEKQAKLKKKLERVGPYVVIGGHIFALPMQFISFLLGGMRYNFRKFLLYSFIGRAIQFCLIFFGFKYSKEYLLPFFEKSFFPWLIYMFQSYIQPVIDVIRSFI